MNKFVAGLLVFAFLVSACAPATTAQQNFPNATAASSTLGATPSLTPTRLPSQTPTMTITPLPTIPTFTPTFDVRSIVTATPAPKAECPKGNPFLQANFRIPTHECGGNNTCKFGGTEDDIQHFLNSGGTIQAVIDRLKQVPGYFKEYVYRDLTGDNIPDLIFKDFGVITGLHILVCNNGEYKVYSPYNTRDGSYYWLNIYGIEDMNLDGSQDIVLLRWGCSGTGCYYLQILEWDGSQFVNLSPDAGMVGVNSVQIQNLDNDKLIELSLTGGIPGQGSIGAGVPWRQEIQTYKWNGQRFSLQLINYSSPEYRFQAVQDADRETDNGHYDQALTLYQKAIFDSNLKWWSPDRREYEAMPYYFPTPVTPYPSPIPDTTEYPRLAAYAYYRMILLHTFLGEMDAAQIQYETLQSKFPAGNPGHPYAEMTTGFREAYQSSGTMYAGCAAAIQYAAERPEILTVLGSDYHGWQSHIYLPADICPFR